MATKFTAIGVMIYAAMLLYAAAFGLMVPGRAGRAAKALFAAGFGVAAAAWFWRWYDVGHAPLQNLFEVFLCLGALVYPISVFCRRVFGVGGEAADALVGLIVLFPAGFVFSDGREPLPPALQSGIFIPHVMAYMLSYVILAKAGIQGVAALVESGRDANNHPLSHEAAAYRMALLGFPLLTLGLVLGSWWGKVAWGDYWNWDPKELWSLVSWIAYLVFFHFRFMFGTRYPRVNASIAVGGLAAIIITLLWVNLGRIFAGLHSYAA
jgi:ABC-type transport system involved in cytochrome c biogenesis permease subunit